ncbi:MAG TPA: hypothetical protein ENJ46_03460 [Hellea balneolensis]|uniref:Uncharacterized protein n=1 Tax=Hellea balneolensis TaxID=287478 RepID=A0A7C3C1P1_9PROT|nr:hypothetical protein [Hellea balneolensis]
MDDTPTKKLYLKSPNGVWLVLGGIASCALPVIIGIWMLYADHLPRNKVLLEPIGMTFIFGSVVAACLGCLSVFLKNDEGFWGDLDFYIIGIKSATLVHICAGILQASTLGEGLISGLFIMFTFGLIVHIPLWLFITWPLSMLCGWVFKRVAVREEDQH